ncbi:MAG: hypothetical protein WBM40_04615, partial [Thiohalocapsa sp.]
VNRAPWQAFGAANADPLNNQVFQLYNLNENFNQSVDIAADHPEKVEEMRKMFVAEAKKYQVFPLDASVGARVAAARPSLTAGRNEYVYMSPMTGLPQGDAPYLLNTSYTITADITVPEGGAEGMIVTSGGRFAGFGFYLLEGKPVFLWNLLDLERIKWEGPEALAPGKHNIEFAFTYDGLGAETMAFNNFSGIGRSGTGTLKRRWQGSPDHQDGEDHPDHPAVGRELRRRLRYHHGREGCGLPAAVPAHGGVGQADHQG